MRKVVPAILFLAVVAGLFAERAARMWHNSHHDIKQLYDVWNEGYLWTPTLIIQAVMTGIFLVSCLFVIFSKRYEAKERYRAYGALGTILGFGSEPPDVE